MVEELSEKSPAVVWLPVPSFAKVRKANSHIVVTAPMNLDLIEMGITDS